MTKKRKIAALIIFLAGLASAFLIARTPGTPAAVIQNLLTAAAVENPSLQFQRQTGITTNDINFTELAAELQFQKILTQNPESLNNLLTDDFDKQKQAMDQLPDLLTGTNLTAEQWTAIAEQFKPTRVFEKKDILTENDNLPVAQLRYLAAVVESNQKNFRGLDASITAMINQWMAGQPENLQRYVNLMPAQIAALLNLPAPADLQTFHLANLNLWQKKFDTYGAMLTLNKDPVKAVIAFHFIESIFRETANLNAALQEKLEFLLAMIEKENG